MMEFVSWDDVTIPNMMGNIKFMFQTTNQIRYIQQCIIVFTALHLQFYPFLVSPSCQLPSHRQAQSEIQYLVRGMPQGIIDLEVLPHPDTL
jgi:hypothetical protein